VTAANTPPAILNMPGTLQPGYFTIAQAPFAAVSVVDPDVGAVETATVTLSASPFGGASDLNGTLSLAGPVAGVSLTETAAGSGVYDLSAGAPAAISAAIDALKFTPTYNASGFTITYMTLAVSDGTATTTASTSTLDGAPIIAGTVAGQTTLDTRPIAPFAHVALTDSPEFSGDTLTITETDATSGVTGDVNGRLSGVGLTETAAGSGVYTTSTATPAALTAIIDALIFTPTAHQGAAGSTVTTDFLINVFNGATTSGNNTTSVVATQTA